MGEIEILRPLVSRPGKHDISPETFYAAVVKGDAPTIRLLVESGANPSARSTEDQSTPLEFAAGLNAPDLLELLIDLGATPDPEWAARNYANTSFSNANTSFSNLPRLHHRFLVPVLQEKEAITLIMPSFGPFAPVTELAARQGDAPPQPLAILLLQQSMAWPTNDGDAFSMRLTVFRKSDAPSEPFSMRLDDDKELPDLKWGDVIELSPDGEAAGGNISYRDGIPANQRWHLMKRVSFPVTVEIDGKAQEIMLRGDRLVFDPAAPGIVPLAGARQVMRFLWGPEVDLRDFTPTGARPVLESMGIVIRREGWPDIRLPFGAAGKDFALRAGDRISLASPEIKPGDVARRRKERVTVRAANGPFVRHFGKNYAGRNPDPRTVPTLLQAVAEVTQVSGMKDAPRDAAALPAWLVGQYLPLAYLQRPDLSAIRIRRLQEDGSEKIIDIDLAKIIAATPEDATIDEARKADMALEGGDIVEIPVLPADEAKPWTGLTPREDSFFSKALICRIQVTDSTGDIRIQEVRYRAPRIFQTEAGPIPLPVPYSVSSLNGSASVNSRSAPMASREGLEESPIELLDLFLKEGDRFVLPPQQRVVPPHTPIPSPPRQRVTPPPPSR